MTHIVRTILAAWTVYTFMAEWAQFRTRNLPREKGGRYGNPFNDPVDFCCVYKRDPCPPNITCVREDGTWIKHAHQLRTSTVPVFRWVCHLCALLWFTVPYWSCGTIGAHGGEFVTVMGGLALAIGGMSKFLSV